MNLQTLILVGLICHTGSVLAQEVKKKDSASQTTKTSAKKKKSSAKNLKGKYPTTIEYGSSSWNKSSAKVDSAFLFIKDKQSGKLAKVVLDETAPDSSTFKGNFAVGWAEEAKTQPEIYIPPQNLVGASGMEKFQRMLREGRLKRKPVVFHTDKDGRQLVDVYDTKEQAMRAYKAFKEEQKIAKRQKEAMKLLEEAKAEKATMEAAKQAEQAKILKKLELEAAQRESERIRLEQLERQKAEQRRKEMEALAEAEKEKRRQKAREFGEAGMKKFIAGDFPGASKLFKLAVETDPLNKDYNLNYGIALYRMKKYNEALVILEITPHEGGRKTEITYYEGLCYYNLKELAPSKEKLEYVKSKEDKNFSASAAFYLGLIYMAEEKYDKAEENLQWVLDNSTSPELDNQAEKYIESLASLKAFAERRKKPFTATGILGLMYDSNVLLTPAGDAAQEATGSEQADIRGVASGSLAYRAIYNKKHEFTPTYFNYLLYSSKDEVSTADPFLNNVSLPYTYKGVAFEKGYKLTIKPQYEVTNMDVNDDGSQEVIINSTILNVDNTFVMNGRWFASYIAEVRQDDSQIASAVGDEDLDALKYTLKTKHINFLDEKKKKLLNSYAAVIMNDAVGKNRTYQRFDLSSTFMKPLNWWKSTWNFGLTMYRIAFVDNDNDRVDINMNITTGISRPINDWLSWSFTAAYINNNSTVDTFTYNRYSLTSNFIATTNF